MKSKIPLYSLLFMILGFLLSLGFLTVILSRINVNSEEDLLNPGTSVLFEEINGRKIHCKDCRDIEDCIQGHLNSNYKDAVVWFGNSQIHAINQYKKGHVGAPSRLFTSLKRDSFDLVTMSYGNANIQEHSVQFIYLSNKISIKKLIIGLVFDDTREDGVRDDVYEFIRSDSFTKQEIGNFAIGLDIFRSGNLSNDLDNSSDNLQRRLERELDNELDSISVVWRLRNEIAYHYFVSLRKLRNFIFNIKPNTIRNIIPNIYNKNLASLRMILEVAKKNNIEVLLYIAPIRSDIQIPYNIADYNQFKSVIENLSSEYRNVDYANLENLVPGKFWGEKQSTSLNEDLELDFMHFTSKGHEILADELYQLVKNK